MILDPLIQERESLWLDATGADAACFLRSDEVAFLEDLQVLDYGGQSDIKGAGQFRN